MLSSSSPKPTSTVSSPSVRLKSATIGIDAPRADQQRLLAPFIGQRALRGGERLHVPVERNRRRVGMIDELGRAIPRHPRRDVIAKRVSDLVGLLPLHQPERNLRGRLRRDHRLGALAGVAADDAVDVAGRARRDLLDQQAILLAGRNRKPDRLEEGFRRQIRASPTAPGCPAADPSRRRRSRGW